MEKNFLNEKFYYKNISRNQYILNTFQLFQGILLVVLAKQDEFEPTGPGVFWPSKNNDVDEGLSSHTSGPDGNWPFAYLDGACKTKSLDHEFTEASAEGSGDDTVCDLRQEDCEYSSIFTK